MLQSTLVTRQELVLIRGSDCKVLQHGSVLPGILPMKQHDCFDAAVREERVVRTLLGYGGIIQADEEAADTGGALPLKPGLMAGGCLQIKTWV